jgi:prepilin-type N-terminal cleavage/methylation domain-containing protein
MDKRSGFSVVELTIVLIIIGIVIAMVMAGTDFLGKSRIKTELAKVNKYAAAITSYYARNSGLPNVKPYGGQPYIFYDPENLYEFGLTPDDFKSHFQVNRDNTSLLIASCWLESDGNPPNIEYNYSTSATKNANVSGTFCLWYNDYYSYYLCHLEKTVDDSKFRAGDALMWGTQASALGADVWEEATGCDNASLRTKSGYYGYKIFQR